ncbi:ABC-type multidrug transport system, ATPase and permease component [Aequorivita sublithincola DSM 14238]|uniref:ABC-type multidrug transport system, ATPase and permease component n=1 Tax=Aequorivita sublithincola (strain DSM 14238 / LMG 21431 / ACAM 643 / 9-3) TaxID=746697 RepID=I3YS88_AEQSU|nr:ABC transporter ATP-binding protein [Aequorivita sublithincola]AFL79856.1 ABC-type multidrug transport system, ATPase and permease component [Aequorivita sublithincola DSM 14238]
MPRPQPKSITDKEKKTSVKDSFKALKTIPRFFREIYRSSPKLFLLNAFSRLINAFTPVVILWVGKMIIDEIILQVSLPNKDFTTLWNYVIIEFSVAVLSDLLGRLINLTDGLLGDLYSNMSSEKIIRKTAELTIAQLEDPEFYDKLERARTQTNSRVDLMSNALGQAESLISMISLIAGLVYFEPILILILIVSIIPSFINEAKFSSTRYSLARSWTAERRELDYLRFIGANNQTAKEIKLFGLTDFIAERFKNLSTDYYLINKKLSLKQSFYGSLFNILGVLSYYGAYVYIILRVLTGFITIGELTFLSGSFNRLRANLQGFFSRFTRISESALYLKDYFDFIDLTVEQTSEAKTPMPKTITQGFQVNDLHFAYAGSETEVLKGVTFKLDAGEKMAFVGQNGAGKTTLIKLFLRFYEPTQGEILLDGINIDKFDVDAYRKRFGVIFQDFFKYEFTLRENIAVGNIDEVQNDEVISYAASKSLAEQVVNEMAYGLEQRLGRRFYKGTELSGGQWQKVALARAYMKDADIMVLDEPTSALDAQAEFDVFERFIALTKGKTSIIISHRFSTVRMADRILVLQNGQVLELGTHEQLMKNPKLYADLFKLQAAGYQ